MKCGPGGNPEQLAAIFGDPVPNDFLSRPVSTPAIAIKFRTPAELRRVNKTVAANNEMNAAPAQIRTPSCDTKP